MKILKTGKKKKKKEIGHNGCRSTVTGNCRGSPELHRLSL